MTKATDTKSQQQKLQLPRHLDDLGIAGAWERHGRGNGVGVALFDSGIDSTEGRGKDHLDPRAGSTVGVVGGRDFTRSPQRQGKLDEYGHGTKVAGIIGASVYDREGKPFPDRVFGVAPEASLYNYKVVKRNGRVTRKGLTDAVDEFGELPGEIGVPIRVVVLPFEDEVWLGERKRQQERRESIVGAVEGLLEKGSAKDGTDLLIVISAGDNLPRGRNLEDLGRLWGDSKRVLVVTTCIGRGENRALRLTANRGPERVRLAAPGTQVRTLTPMGLARVSGTSVSAGIVAGAAAVLFGRDKMSPAKKVAKNFEKLACRNPLDGVGWGCLSF